MEQRTILELILGVYKLDKKYRSTGYNQEEKNKKQAKPKYVKFNPIDKQSKPNEVIVPIKQKQQEQIENSDSSEELDDEISQQDEKDSDSSSQIPEVDSIISYTDDEQSLSDSEEIQCFTVQRQYINGTRFNNQQKEETTTKGQSKQTDCSSIFMDKSILTNVSMTSSINQRSEPDKSYILQKQINMFLQPIHDSLLSMKRVQSTTSRSTKVSENQQLLNWTLLEQLINTSNISIIQQKLIDKYLSQMQKETIPYHLYYPQIDNSLQEVVIDYIIQAYSYDFSVVRIQQNNIMIRLTSIINQLIDEFYLSREDQELVEQIQHSIAQIEKKNQEIRVKTMFCCGRVMQNHSDKFVICSNCGRMCNYQKKSIRKDRNEGTQRNTSYHSIRHFDDVFKQLFIQPLEPIDSITKLQLQEFMERDQKQKVNIEDVRQYLKQLPGGKGSKLNKSDAFIMGLLNGETLKISNIEYQFIKNTFQQFIQILYKNAETRKNTPNCVSFIRKIIDLLYKDLDPERHQQIVKRLHQQKENTTRKMQKTWQFLLSQFDVSRIKQEFKDTIKQQSQSQYRLIEEQGTQLN